VDRSYHFPRTLPIPFQQPDVTFAEFRKRMPVPNPFPLTGKQRVRAAMRREPVDRVPVMCQLAIGHYLLNSDVKPAELWFTSEGFARAMVGLARRYGFDGIIINLPGRDPDWMRHVSQIETAADGSQTVHFTNGERAHCPADDNVQHVYRSGYRRPTIDEVDPSQLYYDDPHDLGGLKYPFYYGLEPCPSGRTRCWPQYLFRTIELVKAEAREELSVHSEIFSPFTQLMELLGYQQGLMALIDEPERCEAILAAYTEGAADLGQQQAGRGADAVLISSAFAGAGFISPRQYDRFVLPYEAEVVRRIHTTGVPVYTHTCGDIGDRLERMVQTGIDGIDTLDPPPLGSVDLADAKRRIGDRVFFKGNIDAVNTLLKKSRNEVKADALARLAIGSPGGGYILSSACSVAPRVPPENLVALVEASKEFGPPR
jgi:uroporphyrinogen-III decarboxylase